MKKNPVRVAPRQERSQRRLAGFLEVAEALFAEVGYEAATMTAIAERSGASIGALYNYFPDKQAVAITLMLEYARQIEEYWQPLIEKAPGLAPGEFAAEFIERLMRFMEEHPGYLVLMSAPIKFSRDPAARRALRMTLTEAFQAKNPALMADRALLAANVAIQMAKGMTVLYASADAKEKPLVAAEFQKVLTLYLATVLK